MVNSANWCYLLPNESRLSSQAGRVVVVVDQGVTMNGPDTERRAHARTCVCLPVRVKGFETDGTAWEETTTSSDVSFGGLSFLLKNHVARGQIVLLNMALPAQMRKFDQGQPTYRVYSLVRDVSTDSQGSWVRLKFLGKKPPKGFEENPSCRYLLPGDPPPEREERRRAVRRHVFLNVRLHRKTAAGDEGLEQSVTEDLSRGGACLPTAQSIVAGEEIVIEEIGGAYRTEAVVRSIHVGKDGVARLHVRFKETPPGRLLPDD
ncbi:MAG: PilZ domain-containing protein [Vicinamibacteria bacterium]|nr:PilZ domain-containing protein [Vicinamibacteria bacterium]